MRFAWLQSNSASSQRPTPTTVERLILVAYNVVWWVPVVLPVFGVISYTAGLNGFLAITLFRALANLYRNNVLPVEQGARYPLRLP